MSSVSTAAYIIPNERLSLRLTILDINCVLPHEEIIPEFLKQLTASIKNDGCLNHPIIVDSESFVVLDGVHRVAALKRLRCRWIPACLVDYKNPAIQISSWHRTIRGKNAVDQLLEELKLTGSDVEQVNKIDENAAGTSPVVAVVKTRNANFIVKSKFERLIDAFDIIERVENQLKTVGLEVKYETESDAQQILTRRQADAVLFTPKLSKQAVIDTVRSGETFVHKATRHIIPARPMRLCVSLHFLRSKVSAAEMNERLKTMLQKKRLKHVPPGRIFEGRRYEEDLYVFEE